MAQTSFVPQSAEEINEQLLSLSDQLIDCLLTEPFQPASGQDIGAALVRLHYAQPEALERTQEVLAAELSLDAGAEEAMAIQSRLTGLLAEVGVGFLRQALQKTLGEQEEIRDALLTQRERAEQAMAQQFLATERARGQLSAVLDATGDAIILVSPDRLALSVNRSFEELLALPSDSTLGRSLADLEPHFTRVFGDINKLRTLVEQVTGTETRGTQDLVQVWPQSRILQLISTPVHGADHQLIGRLHVFRDVTGEREVDRMKSEFVSLVSHELRTPLTSIKGYIDLLLAGEVGEVAAEQQEFLTIVKNNSDRLVALVGDLLDLSRIEAGRVDLRATTLDLSALIGSVVATFRQQVERKGQQVVLDLAATLPAVLGDGDRVTQILTNLVSNAHKYTPSGGCITIRAQPDGAFVRIAVQDTGIGLSVDDRAQLFSKFFRSSNRAAHDVGGTGLGLAITRSLVEMHGGQITVASALDQGSTFSVTLPASIEPVARPVLAATPSPEGRILVVDDEQDIAKLIRRYLERAGYEVILAPNASTGLRLARSERPDLIMLDVLMQGADGFTALEWLKADAATTAIPVMLISILEDNGRGKLLGAVDYLTKPISEALLLEHVAAVLSEARSYLVLVADDELDVRRLLAYILQQRGYRVITAGDGAEAIAMAHRELPDLALLDVRMPGTDGLAALEALRAGPTTRNIPVIMLTASPDVAETSWSIAQRLGAARLLRKPCTAEELAAVIGEHLHAAR